MWAAEDISGIQLVKEKVGLSLLLTFPNILNISELSSSPTCKNSLPPIPKGITQYLYRQDSPTLTCQRFLRLLLNFRYFLRTQFPLPTQINNFCNHFLYLGTEIGRYGIRKNQSKALFLKYFLGGGKSNMYIHTYVHTYIHAHMYVNVCMYVLHMYIHVICTTIIL